MTTFITELSEKCPTVYHDLVLMAALANCNGRIDLRDIKGQFEYLRASHTGSKYGIQCALTDASLTLFDESSNQVLLIRKS